MVPLFFRTIHGLLFEDHINRPIAVTRHFFWQVRRTFGLFPVTLRLSKSVITDDSPTGVLSLVNCAGMYDFNNMILFQDFLVNGGTFLDIGANIGVYSLLMSENPSVRVFSFEPNPSAYRKLSANVAQNHRTNVVLMNVALSAATGEVTMSDDGSSPTNKVQRDGTIKVAAQRLDDCLPSAGAPIVAKIDVEGHELQVLAGAEVSLKSLMMIAIESWPDQRDEIANTLREYGFSGPYYPHAKTKRLFREMPPHHHEDPVYLAGDDPVLPQGWSIA
jgi:FkbM family methyltransferase